MHPVEVEVFVRYANGLSGRSQKPVPVSSNLTRTTVSKSIFRVWDSMGRRLVFEASWVSSIPSLRTLMRVSEALGFSVFFRFTFSVLS